MILRPLAAFSLAVVSLTGCGNGMKSKEKVQAAILERIQSKTGLDVNALDVTTTSVSFDKNMAYATVAFHPKGDTVVSHGMAMKYTLEDRGGKWVVVGVSNPQGGVMGQSSGGSQLPPGHPPLDGAGPEGATHLGNPHNQSSSKNSGANEQSR
jgi:hypothetical protein